MQVDVKYDFFAGYKNPKSKSLKLFGVTIASFYYHKGFGWFRLFGRGIKWKDTTRHSLIFSERYGYVKSFKIGKWLIGILKKGGS